MSPWIIDKRLPDNWERIIRAKILTICLAALSKEKDALRIVTDDIIEWLKPK